MPVKEERCATCGGAGPTLRFERCPICFKRFCRACATRRYGKLFCSASCAEHFYFGDADDADA